MDFGLSDEEQLIQKTARDFAAGELRPNFRDWESAGEVPQAVRQAYFELGLPLIDVPEALGGSELSAFAKTLVLEEIAYGDAGAALALEGAGPAVYPLLEMGKPDQVRPFLEVFPTGRAALVVDTEDRFAISDGTITGTAPWVPAGELSWVVILQGENAYICRDGLAQNGLVLAPVQSHALTASGSSELVLERAPIALTLTSAEGAVRALARARLYIASLLVGVMRAAREYSSDYACERVVFGKPVAHHQGASFMIVDMATGVDVARMAVWQGAHALDTGGSGKWECAAALWEAAEQAIGVTVNAVQLLGGHGFMTDHPVEKWMREARALSLMLGGNDRAALDAMETVVAA